MKITIQYDSSWRNSFLDGSNNEPLPKQGRNFVGSMTALKTEGNFKQQEITLNTVMGVLNRLIGDQRKLYQARNAASYYFKDMEAAGKIRFTDREDKKIANQEVVYLRNVSGSTDQNAFTGLIKVQDPAFQSDFSMQLWGILALSIEEVIAFILRPTLITSTVALDPLSIITKLEDLNSLKTLAVDAQLETALTKLKATFPEVDYKLTAKGELTPISLYTSALYIQLQCLSDLGHDLTKIVTKSGGLSGISKRGFTKKNFMDRYTTGDKKLIWGNPYLLKQKVKGIGEVTSMLTKASGTLEIELDIPQSQAQALKEMIENAGVSSFYLGKKGLAYLEKISTKEVYST